MVIVMVMKVGMVVEGGRERGYSIYSSCCWGPSPWIAGISRKNVPILFTLFGGGISFHRLPYVDLSFRFLFG